MSNHKNLIGYQKAFALAMEIFHLTKKFPKEEMFGLTSQIRRSSRAVCSAIGEGYRKRIYEKHFISKISDADSENTETQIWLEFCLACEYIDEKLYEQLHSSSDEVGRLLAYMMANPKKFLPTHLK